MNFTVVGIGYVGASTALLLAQKHHVSVVDTAEDRLDLIRHNRSPVADEDMDRLLHEKDLNLSVSERSAEDYRVSDFVLIATPTNLDEKTRRLDTSSVESVIADIVNSGSRAAIVVKSTIPIGFMERMRRQYPDAVLLSSPEFLREGRAFYDQLHPSRIVIGADKSCEKTLEAAEKYAEALEDCIDSKDVPVLIMSYGEAESVKLFSNTYLAMRVAFFNELDTLAEAENYDTRKIIEGICLDSRIGDYYNNPSFGYGGYCLPKDTKELLSVFDGLPEKLIRATVESNETRMNYIVDSIMAKLKAMKAENPVVGIYRLIMKRGSGNFRESSALNILSGLREKGAHIIIYEPLLREPEMDGCEVIRELAAFKEKSDLIVANRKGAELDDVMDKVYTRDTYPVNGRP